MRWKEPSVGDTRIKKYFAILPVTIKGETRWLEMVKVRERFGRYLCWYDEEFID
ncbi:hypothetical protein ACV3Z5_13800 [Clostridium perfringens]